MNVVFLSNYFNHHQKPLSDSLAARVHYTFIATAQITAERLSMGWGTEEDPEYVCYYDREPDRAEQCLAQADVVIAGSAPERLVRSCIRRKQLVFRYSERPLKNGAEWHKYVPRFVKWHMQNPVWKPIYLLCASAYTAGDYARFGLFRGKAFRWGYFPEVKRYENMDALLTGKQKASILWVGRYLDWKHPDAAIQLAAMLKMAGVDYDMTIIGTGPMEQILREMIAKEGLRDQVHLLGTMKPQEVRRYMERSEIFLFTSDRHEGWGAVLNEAMNSGCAVVANDAIGSVPYLVRDGENGLIYRSGDVDALYDKVKVLLDDQEKCRTFGVRAYSTMINCWNAEIAADRFVELAGRILSGAQTLTNFESGPCSVAQNVKENWHKAGDVIADGHMYR